MARIRAFSVLVGGFFFFLSKYNHYDFTRIPNLNRILDSIKYNIFTPA